MRVRRKKDRACVDVNSRCVLFQVASAVFHREFLCSLFKVVSVEMCSAENSRIYFRSICSRNPERIQSLVNSQTINGVSYKYLNCFTHTSHLDSSLRLSSLSKLYYINFYFTMAPKKQEPKKDVLKPLMEPEAAKEPDFDPRSIMVCLSV